MSRIRTGPEGFRALPGHLDPAACAELAAAVAEIVAVAPFCRYVTPGRGRSFSIDMTNAGPLGWVADRAGYRYSPVHPVTGQPWPPIPPVLLALWDRLTGWPQPPECCLVNRYVGPGAKLGLHRDEDEAELTAPILNLSLGDTALFRLGGPDRSDPTRSFAVTDGTAMVFAGPARLAYHGVDRIIPGSSPAGARTGALAALLPDGGRINLTLRRVTRAG